MKCPECGKTHNLVLQGKNGKIEAILDTCYDCFMKNLLKNSTFITEKITLEGQLDDTA